jgi:chitodextrinase
VVGRAVVAGAALAVALAVVVPAAPLADGTFFVGFSEDRVKDGGASVVTPAADLGAKAFRVTLMWEPGQTELTSSAITGLNRASSAAADMRLVLAVYATAGWKAPVDAAARDAYCSYVRNALARYPSIRDVVIWNEPNKRLFWNPQTAAPALYEALLARCYDLLHGSFAGVNVIGLALSSTGNDDAGSTSPGAFIRAVGDAFRSSGRARRVLDTVGFHPYSAAPSERPWRKHIQSKMIGEGDWNKLAYNLWLAFNGTAQPTPDSGGISIWYLEAGFQTTIDPGKQGLYTGAENVAVIPDYAGGEPSSPPPDETSPAPDQFTQILDAVRLADCQPDVGAYFNFLLADEPVLTGWQSGAYWADLSPKDSIDGFRAVITEVNAGAVDCDALKGGRPSADFMPPTAPSGLQGSAVPTPPGVVLSWSAATDDASAISYRVYRNGALVATTGSTGWTDTNVAIGTTYTYSVRAIDAAGNLGDSSGSVDAGVIPAVSGMNPTHAQVGEQVVLTGTNFVGVSGVSLAMVNASYTVDSPTQITVTVPTIPYTVGRWRVSYAGGTAVYDPVFTVDPAPVPTITAMNPTHAQVGEQVVLTGTNFVGVSGVSLAMVNASYTVDSATQITVTVPTIPYTVGRWRVTNAGGTAVYDPVFTVDPAPVPTITAMNPTHAQVGQQVVLTGTNFVGVTAVSLAMVNASYTVDSATQITVTVPTIPYTVGRWRVTNAGGTAVYDPVFTVDP